jgi:hypothetical protein
MTMSIYKVDPSQSPSVDMDIQNTISTRCICNVFMLSSPICKQSLSTTMKKNIHAEKWPFWAAQNDSLRQIVYGTYKGKTLPVPFVNAIHMIKNDAFRSFFTQ